MPSPVLASVRDGCASLPAPDVQDCDLHCLPAAQDGQDATPAGLERVAPETLAVIDRLFPKPTGGVAFLALVLRWAQVKQRPPSERVGSDGAVITVQSIRELARLIGWGYDTTHKYVVLFCALGLLVKQRVAGKVELHVALGRDAPPLTLDALDRRIERSRPKVQSYARKVKRRYLLLYGNRAIAASSPLEPSESPIADLDEAIQRIRHLLEREPSPTRRRALLTALIEQIERIRREYYREGDPHGRYEAKTFSLLKGFEQQNGRGVPPTDDSLSPETAENGGLFPSMGDSPQGNRRANGRLLPQTGDPTQTSPQGNGRLSPPTEDSLPPEKPENGSFSAQTGDSAQAANQGNGRLAAKTPPVLTGSDAQNGRLLPQTGDSLRSSETAGGRLSAKTSLISPTPGEGTGRLLPKTGDSRAESPVPMGDSGSESLPNVNVSLETLINDHLNVNVKDVAAFLQTMFHEEPRKRGYYYQLHTQYPRPECWLAAAIKTLVGMYQAKTVKNAGRYFYDCCVRLHAEATLPPEEQALVAQYAHLSYHQVLAALAAPPARATPAPRGREPDQYEVFVARRRAELLAEFQARHPGVSPTSPPAGADQYAAFVARRTQELKAASAAKGA